MKYCGFLCERIKPEIWMVEERMLGQWMRTGDASTRSLLVSKDHPGCFPGGAVVKNPPANAGDTGSSPGPGRSHMPRSN